LTNCPTGTAALNVQVIPSFCIEEAVPGGGGGGGGAGAVIVSAEFADFELSAMLVAVTANEPDVLPAV
jgi:hypothetical protein